MNKLDFFGFTNKELAIVKKFLEIAEEASLIEFKGTDPVINKPKFARLYSRVNAVRDFSESVKDELKSRKLGRIR